MSKTTVKDTFKLGFNKNDNGALLTISPEKACGYEPKAIQLTPEQWNELQYHFAKKENATGQEGYLVYVL